MATAAYYLLPLTFTDSLATSASYGLGLYPSPDTTKELPYE